MIFPKPQATLPPHCMTLKGRLKAVILLREANLIEGLIQLDENKQLSGLMLCLEHHKSTGCSNKYAGDLHIKWCQQCLKTCQGRDVNMFNTSDVN